MGNPSGLHSTCAGAVNGNMIGPFSARAHHCEERGGFMLESTANSACLTRPRVAVNRARPGCCLFARITGSSIDPQFTHRVLGVRSDRLSVESHQLLQYQSTTA